MREPTPLEFCREAAWRFQLLADIEPWPHLRRQFTDRAAQYRAQAVLLEKPPSEPQGGRQRAA